jgi:hypothetical protein
MKELTDMRLFLIFCFLFSYGLTHAQLRKIPHERQTSATRQTTTARVSTTPQTQSAPSHQVGLPFWDDFSFNLSSKGHVNDNLWQVGQSVWVNSGMGINPPTINVASFDGLDSLGKPYTDVALTKGLADELVSQPILMDSVPVANRDSVFLSFYYEYQGNGEPPDDGDDLTLWIKKGDLTWIQAWSSATDTLKDRTKFIKVKIGIADTCPSCFYDNFQFRFQNFARLSGQFDNWNLDYVYLSNGKSQYLPYKPPMPDRAIVYPPTSVVKQYQSIPVKHLLDQGEAVLDNITFPVSNLRADILSPQPLHVTSELTIVKRLNGITSAPATNFYDSITLPVRYGTNTNYVFGTTRFPQLSIIDPKTDSLALTFNIYLNKSDNLEKYKHSDGDYDSIVYEGIDFRVNDTIRTSFIFTDYYAYDDGEGESAVSLTNPGNHLAYQYDMMYSSVDTLTAIDIFFPHVGDESNQVIHLMVIGDQLPPDVSRTKPYVLSQQDLIVKRTENNLFTRVVLDTAVQVGAKFYIGYRQNVAANIGVGFDGDSDSSDKLFVNLGAGWEPVNVHGNLMMRPIFGNAKKTNPITSIEEKKITFYPNPNHGTFYLSQTAQSLQIVDIRGEAVSFDKEDTLEATQVTLHNPTPGIYLARYYNGKQWRTEKIMVLP